MINELVRFRSLSLITVLLIFFCSCVILKNEKKKEFFIKWDKNRDLKWEDFKAKPNIKSGHAAVSKLSIELEISDYPVDEAKIKVYSVFYPHLSWVSIFHREDYVLRHEEYHFHIEEIFARKMGKKYSETSFELNNCRQKIWEIYNEISKECSNYQKLYDEKTDRSRNEIEQLEWEKRLAIELNRLDKYDNPEVAIEIN